MGHRVGVGKHVAPAIGKYLTEVGILSQKGVPAYIKNTQNGLGMPEKVDYYKKLMKDESFRFDKNEFIIAGFKDSKGCIMCQKEIIVWYRQLKYIMRLGVQSI